MKKLVIGIIFTVAAAATLPCAAAGAAFTYQGVIKEVDGATPSVKNRTIEFRIYDGPGTSAQVLWGRAYNVLLDANGLFNTSLTDAAGSEIDGARSRRARRSLPCRTPSMRRTRPRRAAISRWRERPR